MFFILLAIALIGLVTAALRSSGLDGANIDKEQVLLNTTRIRQYTSELERAVTFIMSSGASEVDIRFAHPDAPSDYGDIATNPTFQVFNREGGGATYRQPPGGVNDGSPWEFYGHTHLPYVGSGKADLVAVLPNVTQEVCDRINDMNEHASSVNLTDDGAGFDNCVYGGNANRFDDATQYNDTLNELTDDASFPGPAMQACVSCTAGGNHFYHVLHVR